MLDTSYRTAYNEDHEAFRDTVRKVFAEHMTPYLDPARGRGHSSPLGVEGAGRGGHAVPDGQGREWRAGPRFRPSTACCAKNCPTSAVRPVSRCRTTSLRTTSNVLGTDEQRAKYLPGMVSGDVITAIAMTEPGAGSDLQGIRTTAIKDGNHLVVNGSKTYITNGQNADMVIVVAKTDPSQGAKGTTLVLVDADTEGFERGRNLDKIGQHSADTSELFFNDCRVAYDQYPRRRGTRLHSFDGRTAAGTAWHCRRRTGRRAARFRRGGELHQGPQGFRQNRVRIPEHQIRPRRPQGQAAGRLGRISTGRSKSTSLANSPRTRRVRRSYGTPICSGRPATRRCNCMAGRAI